MLNEGIIVNNAASLMKSEIIDQMRHLGSATPGELERAVFKSLTGHDREEVDWDIEDNQAGYFTWMKSFDQLLVELIEDGYMSKEGPSTLVAMQPEPGTQYSHLVYPSGHSG